MTGEPLVSVVMSAYNAASTIERAVSSVLRQTMGSVELIVVDDGSSDETAQILATMSAADPRLVVLPRQPNAGVSAARNRALGACRGSWVTFLDADDEFEPTRLAVTMAAATDDVDIVVCAHTLVRADGVQSVRRNKVRGIADGDTALAAWLADDITPFMWDTTVRAHIATGETFPTDFHRGEDLVYGVRVAARARRVAVVEAPLSRYYVMTGSLTWGRVPPVDQTKAAVTALGSACQGRLGNRRIRAALSTARCLMWLNTASQAARNLPPAEADAYVRACGANINWRDIVGGVKPVYAAAALVVKSMPGLYRRLYGAYIARVYGLRRSSS